MSKKDDGWTVTDRIAAFVAAIGVVNAMVGIVGTIMGICTLILAVYSQPNLRCTLFKMDCPLKPEVSTSSIPEKIQSQNTTVLSASSTKQSPVFKANIASPANNLNPTKDKLSGIHKKYENDFVIFEYPSNWHETNIVNMSKEFITFVSNEPAERLSVAVDSVRQDLKLEKISDFLEKEKSDIKSSTSNVAFVAMGFREINGRRFGEIVSSEKAKKNKIVKSFFIHKNKIYTITYIKSIFDLSPDGINIVLESINLK